MKLTVALLAVLLAPVSSSFLHAVPVPSKPTVKLPIPHGHPEARGVKNPKPVAVAAKVAAVAAKLGLAAPKPAAKVEAKPVVASTVKQSPHVVPVPSKPTVKLPIPHGHPEAHGVKNPKPVAVDAKVAAKVAAVAAKMAAVAAPKVAAKVEAKVSPHVVPVPAKPTVKLPTPPGHPEGPQTKKVGDAVKPAAKVVTKPVVPKAAVAVAVIHVQVKVEAKPAKHLTTHDHAASAQKSADEALHHLEKAKKAFEKTKANVKETLKVGKKIEGTADKVKTLYEAPKKAKTPTAPKESDARSVAVPALVAMLIAALASC